MRVFSPDQPLPRGVSLIEASAGTGKTYTITTLFLRLVVEEGLSVQDVLVVTFTEAATAELRDRIRTRLSEALRAFEAGDSEDEVLAMLLRRARERGDLDTPRRRLRLALTDFDLATISTIHGFCRRMLQENAFESGADFDAELLTDTGDLVQEVVEDFWTTRVHDAPELLVRALEKHVGIGSLRRLAEEVLRDPGMTVLPDPADAPDTPDATGWLAAFEAAARAWPGGHEQAREVLGAAALHRNVYKPAAVAGWFSELGALLGAPPAPGDKLPVCLDKLRPAALAKKTRKGNEPPAHPLFDALDPLGEEEAALQEALAAWSLHVERAFAGAVPAELDARKRRRHVQSFDDLLHLLDRALAREEGGDRKLATAIARRFPAALIDEFQDTDPVQYRIFSRVFAHRRGWLFLIGDPKQAIYAFRGADVFAYLRAAREAGTDASYTLSRNFRSDDSLVQAVERIFGREEVTRPFLLEDLRFVPVEAHHADGRLVLGDGVPRQPLQLRFVPRSTAKTYRGVITAQWAGEHLPRYVAEDVATFLANDATISGRPVGAGDVAVLVRTNRQAAGVQRALRALRIPSVLHGDASVFDTAEAMELEGVLAAVAEPGRADLVRAALASELMGVDAVGLAELELDERAWEGWLERFAGWHRRFVEQGFMRMLRALLEEHLLDTGLLSWTDGERRMTNVLHLGELLHAAGAEESLGPAGLVHWLQQQRWRGAGDTEARQVRLESDAHAVQVVTVHKAKGLQYPLVWCPFLWAGVRKARRPLRFHDPADGWARKLDLGSEDWERHAELATEQELAEDLRLLYVALTRAEHRCTVFSGRFHRSDASALGYVLHPGPPGGGDPVAAARAHIRGMSDEALWGELEALAAGSAGTVGLGELAARPEAAWSPAVEVVPELTPRRRTRPLDRLWRRTSFSGLTRAASHAGPAAAGRDRDELAPGEPEDLPAPADDGPALLAGFPKGARPGTFLHEVLEGLDFAADDAVLRARVEEGLSRHALPDGDADEVCAALRSALATPLPGAEGPFALRDVAAGRRLDELDFVFPVRSEGGEGVQVSSGDLAAALRAHPGPGLPAGYPDALAGLGFLPVRGFLAGAIDLVFEHGGRWWLVDYKSNHLGPRLSDYAPDRLADAMAARHYVLQYHLYALALHRWLLWGLPDYDWERDFGGVLYLFLRGMSPATGGRTGVFFDRPPGALLERLSGLVDGPGGAR